MHSSLVMTVIGADRTGLVDSIASIVTEHGGNWLESRLSRLGGQFAGMVRVQVPSEKEQAFLRALKSLETQGLTVVAQVDRNTTQAKPKASTVLEIVGQDRPGIVRQISNALARHGVNVEELDTECSSAPMSGETLFKARAQLHVPVSCNLAELRKDVEKIAQDLLVDVSLAELTKFEAGR
jgi:glycine cleavage system regulatory protein